MHHNYDYVLCSSKAYQEHLMEGFQISADQLVFIPLPRLDLLKDDTYRQEITSRIYQKYPKLTKKKTILYAPTFRKNYDITKNVKKLINQVDFSKYNLIIKLHPLDTAQIQDDRVIIDPFFTSFDMLFVSDFVISDYSCFIYEALFLEKPIFLYDFDLKKYMSARDVYIDYEKDLPFYKSENPKNIIKAIENKNYSKLKLKKFKEKYIHMTDDTCVNRLVSFIKQILM